MILLSTWHCPKHQWPTSILLFDWWFCSCSTKQDVYFETGNGSSEAPCKRTEAKVAKEIIRMGWWVLELQIGGYCNMILHGDTTWCSCWKNKLWSMCFLFTTYPRTVNEKNLQGSDIETYTHWCNGGHCVTPDTFIQLMVLFFFSKTGCPTEN